MAIRRKRNLLDAVLSESKSAVCILDSERRIRFFSPGMQEQTGWGPEDVEGLLCNPSIPPNATPVELLTSAFTPSVDVLNGRILSLDAVLPKKNGTSLRVRLTFIPLLDDSGGLARVMLISNSSIVGGAIGTSMSQKLHAEITALRIEFRRRFSDQSFIGQCPQIRLALEQAELLKSATCGYSIVGPVGSGRRHLAKLIHVAGSQSDSSLVPLDCRLLTTQQVCDTLRSIRRLAAAHKTTSHQTAGTLVLLDGDRCPREVQQWILENLTDEVLGIRIVSTSQLPLRDAKAEGWLMPEFHDLFRAVEISLPAMHERGHDLRLLTQHFIQDCRRNLETSAESVAADAMRELQFYRWPGNVRELQNVIAEACQNSFDVQVKMEHLPFSFTVGMEAQKLPPMPEASTQSLDWILRRFEIEVIKKTLAACRGNKAEAARRLGMTRPKLYRRMNTLGIEDEE